MQQYTNVIKTKIRHNSGKTNDDAIHATKKYETGEPRTLKNNHIRNSIHKRSSLRLSLPEQTCSKLCLARNIITLLYFIERCCSIAFHRSRRWHEIDNDDAGFGLYTSFDKLSQTRTFFRYKPAIPRLSLVARDTTCSIAHCKLIALYFIRLHLFAAPIGPVHYSTPRTRLYNRSAWTSTTLSKRCFHASQDFRVSVVSDLLEI